MQEVDIHTMAKKKYKATTNSKHIQPVAPNHLNATILDLYSRKIVDGQWKIG